MIIKKDNWIFVDPIEFIEHRKKNIHRHNIPYVSPYDIPEALQGYLDKENKKFIIEFKYRSNDPKYVENFFDVLTFHTGVNSSRIYKIEIDINKIDKKREKNIFSLLKQAILNSINVLAKNYKDKEKFSNQMRFDLTKQIIKDNEEEIYKEFPPLAA